MKRLLVIYITGKLFFVALELGTIAIFYYFMGLHWVFMYIFSKIVIDFITGSIRGWKRLKERWIASEEKRLA